MNMQETTSQSASPWSLSDDGTAANPGNRFQTCKGQEGDKESQAWQGKVMFDQPDDFLQLRTGLGGEGRAVGLP